MKHYALLLAAALPLAGCNSDPQVTAQNASAEEVARKVEASGASTNVFNPGLWQSTVTLEEMSIPGLPPEAAAQMSGVQGQAQVSEQCLTAEQAKRPKEDFFGGRDNCRYERFTMGNGKIEAVMNCSEGRTSQKMTMAGTYDSDSYQVQMAMRAEGGGETDAMGLKMRIDAKRTGECAGKQG